MNVKIIKFLLKHWFFSTFIFLLIILILYSFVIAPNWICITRLIIETDKISSSAQPIKIVHLTDFHMDSWGYREKRAIKTVRKEQPDLILFSGDYLNNKSLTEELFRLTSKLVETAPVYFTLGNWDSKKEWRILKQAGAQPVYETNRKVQVCGSVINIFSLKYSWADWPESEERKHFNLIAPLEKEVYSIMLAHTPDHFPLASESGIDLVLAGHTHGGQVNFPFVKTGLIYSKFGDKYRKGLFKEGNSILYVNRGIGMTGNIRFRIRFFSRPEILILTIKPQQDENETQD